VLLCCGGYVLGVVAGGTVMGLGAGGGRRWWVALCCYDLELVLRG
jgi:hypothetical protein